MIKGYEQSKVLGFFTDSCCLYEVSKEGQKFLMYEYETMDASDEYNFKVLTKLAMCEHVLKMVDKFQAEGKSYFITEYASSNLLELQYSSKPEKVFSVEKALHLFSKIIEIVEQIHDHHFIFRNFRLQNIHIEKENLYVSDVTMSQYVKRRERHFELVGLQSFMAPEFFTEDGYGYQVDIWAVGVCLFQMISGANPFETKNLKKESQILSNILQRRKQGFQKYSKEIENSKDLQNLFNRLFEVDYSKRITIKQLKAHPCLKKYFKQEKIIAPQGDDALSKIDQNEEEYDSSIFISMLRRFPCHYDFHKEEVVLDFMEHSSEILKLQSAQLLDEELRVTVNFSILKVALWKAENLIDIIYGKTQPSFKINPEEWIEIRKTSAFAKVRQKIEKKRKIIEMLFNSSFMNLKDYDKKLEFYTNKLPTSFAEIKHEYRKNLNRMFESYKSTMKKLSDRTKVRKICESLARLTILCLINSVFQEKNIRKDFEMYFAWSKKDSLEDLQGWIQTEKVSNLKNFIKTIINKYLE